MKQFEVVHRSAIRSQLYARILRVTVCSVSNVLCKKTHTKSKPISKYITVYDFSYRF